MPVRGHLHLTGHLQESPYGLLLHTGGGIWELEAQRRSRRLIGCEVEVTGRRAGFNGLICDYIWLAGQPRPHRLRLNIEYHLAAAVSGYSLVAFLVGLAGYLR